MSYNNYSAPLVLGVLNETVVKPCTGLGLYVSAVFELMFV